MGTESDQKEIRIGANLESNVKSHLVQMLRDYVEVFAWSYEDMPGLDTDIVLHHLQQRKIVFWSSKRFVACVQICLRK